MAAALDEGDQPDRVVVGSLDLVAGDVAVLWVSPVLNVGQSQAPLPRVEVQLDRSFQRTPGAVPGQELRQVASGSGGGNWKKRYREHPGNLWQFYTFLHFEGAITLCWGPQPTAGGRQALRHGDGPVLALASLLVDEAPVPGLVVVHVVVAHLGHQVVLGALLPVGQALHLLHSRLAALDVDARLEVDLESLVVGAGVQVALGETALVEAGSALGVGEGEGTLERAPHRL